MNIDELLSVAQRNAIVDIIKTRCRQYRTYVESGKGLYYELYTSMRKQHDLTSAILSGFSPSNLRVEGLTVVDIKYGLNDQLCQPEIRSKNGIFHIYSSSSDLKGNQIKKRAAYYNSDLNEYPVFFVIIFKTDKRSRLQMIKLKIFDSEAQVIEEHDIYTISKIMEATA